MAARIPDERCLVLIDITYFDYWKTQQAGTNNAIYILTSTTFRALLSLLDSISLKVSSQDPLVVAKRKRCFPSWTWFGLFHLNHNFDETSTNLFLETLFEFRSFRGFLGTEKSIKKSFPKKVSKVLSRLKMNDSKERKRKMIFIPSFVIIFEMGHSDFCTVSSDLHFGAALVKPHS